MATETKQATCAERVDAHMASRFADLKVLFRTADCDAEELRDYLSGLGGDQCECDSCKGSGWVDAEGEATTEDADGAEECSDCDGSGLDRDEADEQLREEVCNYGLSFDYVAPDTFGDQPEGYWRYQFSTGGPADELRLYGDHQAGRPHKMEYWFLDWFDGAFRHLSGDAADTGRAIWDDFGGMGMLESTYEAAMEDYEPRADEDNDDSDDDEAEE